MLQPEDGFMKAETCSCCVLVINYSLYNEVVLDYKFTHFINYLKHNGDDSIEKNYDMIYLLTTGGLTPGGSITVHIYTQTIHRTTQLTARTTQLTKQHN